MTAGQREWLQPTRIGACPVWPVIGKADGQCVPSVAVIVARTAELAEEHLSAATMRCPRCAGRLIRWGYARPRTIRSHGVATVGVIPRRVRCTDCRRTDVILPAAFQTRRADTTAVIAEALRHKADGVGYRRIAAHLGRPESTVRRWLDRATTAHVQWIHHRGVQRLIQVAPEVFTELRLGANPLRDALSVLAAAAYWDRHRFGFIDPPWTLIGTYTRGRLLAPPG